jgi:hypothetical protein
MSLRDFPDLPINMTPTDVMDQLAECCEALVSAFRDSVAGLRPSELGINPQALIDRAEEAIENWRSL